jgi:hypothetical protein
MLTASGASALWKSGFSTSRDELSHQCKGQIPQVEREESCSETQRRGA